MKYRADIDGLRALAVGGVVLFHTGTGILPGGYVGVDIFFVISGYLISTIIAREVAADRFSFADFYARRARRILPALIAVLAGSLAAASWWLMPKDLEAMSEGLLATLLFFSNFFYWEQVGYFDTAAELRPLIHTWSLAIEEQFYLFFPLVFLLVWRVFGPRGRVLMPLAVSFASLVAAEAAIRWDASAAFYWTPFRIWEFGAGIVLAQSGWRPRTRTGAEALGAAGLAAVLGSMVFFQADTPVPGLMGLIPILGAVALIGAVSPQGTTFAARLLSLPPMVGIGLISYSLYLWHQPVLAIARLRAAEEPDALGLVLLVALTVALAYLTWRFVEQPFRRPAVVPARPFMATALAGLVALGVSSQLLDNGWPDRFDGRTREILAAASRYAPAVQPCTGGSRRPNDPACILGDPERPRAVLLGDSHAMSLATGLREAFDREGITLELRAIPGCPMVRGMRRENDRNDCAAKAEAFATLPDEARIVIMAARWPIHMWGRGFDNEEGGSERTGTGALIPVDADEASPLLSRRSAALARHLRTQVANYVAEGRKVVLVRSLPVHGWDVPSRAATLQLRQGDERAPLSVDRNLFEARAAPAEVALDGVPSSADVVHVPTAPVFCEGDRCLAERDGLPLYSDDDHLNMVGSRLLGEAVVDAVRARGWLDAGAVTPVARSVETSALR